MRGPGRGWGVGDWVSGLVYTLNVFVDRNFSFLSLISFLAKCSDKLIKYMYVIHAKLSRIIWECPGHGTDLPLSCAGHHISRIKSSFKLFCALV